MPPVLGLHRHLHLHRLEDRDLSPSSTVSPTATSIFQMVPVMWASIPATALLLAVAAVTIARNERRHRRHRVARDEAERLPATLAALAAGARVLVADDGWRDGTAALARAAGAEVVSAPRRPRQGRGGDAGGGVGLALRFAGWAVRRRCGPVLDAPISGQRALSPAALQAALPFAPRFGMEIGMAIDVARAGLRVREYPLPLEHRATGRSARGFLHRGRQLADFVAVYAVSRRPGRRRSRRRAGA